MSTCVGRSAPGLEAGAGLDPADAVRAAGAHGNGGGVPAVRPEGAADDLQRGGWLGFIHLDGQCFAGGQPGVVGAGTGDHIAGCIGGNELFRGTGHRVAGSIIACCSEYQLAGIPIIQTEGAGGNLYLDIGRRSFVDLDGDLLGSGSPIAVGGAAQCLSWFIDIGIKVGIYAAAIRNRRGFIVDNFPDDADIAGVPVVGSVGAGDYCGNVRR